MALIYKYVSKLVEIRITRFITLNDQIIFFSKPYRVFKSIRKFLIAHNSALLTYYSTYYSKSSKRESVPERPLLTSTLNGALSQGALRSL